MLKMGLFLTVVLSVFAIGTHGPHDAWAAASATVVHPPAKLLVQKEDLVYRVQRGLSRQGFFLGAVDGIYGPETEAAVRAYQSNAGLPVDGVITEQLVANLETDGKVSELMARLQEGHDRALDAARQALLSRPETRNLLEGETATTITHDSASCFDKPKPRCLLREASVAASNIKKTEMRNWALGEILTAQARAGLADEAMKTVRRINDPQLIVVALRDIAKGQAEAGRFDDALKAAAIIPDIEKQVDAYIAIAEIQVQRGEVRAAVETAEQLLGRLKQLKKPLDDVVTRTRLAVILNRGGNRKEAMRNLNAARRIAHKINDRRAREEGLRHVAAALAEVGLADSALQILRKLKNGSGDTPVLMAAATGQALLGASDAALITVDAIEAVRYRALVLSRIAAHQGGLGDIDRARKTLDKAMDEAAKIRFPFAKSYAFSRIALALNDVGINAGDDDELMRKTLMTAKLIADDRLRAQILWMITDARTAAGSRHMGAALRAANDNTDEIRSPLSRVWMLCDIAEKRAKAGDSEGAWKMYDIAFSEARTITSAWGRSRAITKVALTLSSLADFTASATASQ